eukprot:TRINITY_DN3439_c0_g1_i26.p2 TRINITY_DN3439_c0_g1~~TRINITY_DN3439_c0_g1_i26.p2  ORF type:complete len:191 (+),score=58.68 TRINITY_DN3439_c0_g1_i26:3214-3786(+)
MYLLLIGRPPFYEKTKEDTVEAIKRANPDFACNFPFILAPAWKAVDKEAKDLLSRMLTKDPLVRITANEAVQHPWLRKYAYLSKEEENENLIQSLRNLKNFRAETILQKAVLSYIASQEIDPQEEKKLKHLFDTIDTDKSGQISFQELSDKYTEISNSKAIAQQVSALSLIHICRCRRLLTCRSRWSPYH